MSIDDLDPHLAEDSSKKKLFWLVLKALIALSVLCMLALFGLWIYGNVVMSSRAASLKDAFAQFEAKRTTKRPVLMGKPMDGNAVHDYQAIEWILSPRKSWKEDIPPEGLPSVDIRLGFDHPERTRPKRKKGGKKKKKKKGTAGTTSGGKKKKKKKGKPPPTDYSYRNYSVFDDVLKEKEPLQPGHIKLLDTYHSLIGHVRAGLRKVECRWAFKIEDGLATEIPSAAYSFVARLMACQALRSRRRQRIRLGLEIVALGRDLAYHPALAVKSRGQLVQWYGLRSLERTLRERKLRKSTYRRIIETLGRVERIDFAEGMRSEVLFQKAWLATLAGHPTSDPMAKFLAEVLEESTSKSVLEALLPRSFYAARNWDNLAGREEEILKLDALPYKDRKTRYEAMRKELEQGAGLLNDVVRMVAFLGDVGGWGDEAQANIQTLRVLAAAHLYRRKKGAFPQQIGDLKDLIKKNAPGDDLLVLEVEKKQLRCYPVYSRLKKHAAHRKELLFTTGVPKN